jgi:predicted lactoylglutathione lyase
MELGAFSVSLAVKDLQASKAFYEKLGSSSTSTSSERTTMLLERPAQV